MIKRPPQQTKVHIVHKTIKKSQMTTDYVKRHGLKPTMRAFSVNDTMINGAPEHAHYWPLGTNLVPNLSVFAKDYDSHCREYVLFAGSCLVD